MRPIAMLLFAIALAGCQGTAGPSWLHPGDADTQQKRALRYDPYPEPDTGPPVDGARPRDYETPLADPARARWFGSNDNANRWWKPQPAAAPAIAPPAAVGPPAATAPAPTVAPPPATTAPPATPSPPQ